MWKNLRNALTHGLTINKGSIENLGNKKFRELKKGIVHIHSEKLYIDFKNALQNYFNDLRRKKDTILTKNFERRFKRIFQATYAL